MAARGARNWIAQLYFYAAAGIGLVLVIAGIISSVFGFIDAINPRATPQFGEIADGRGVDFRLGPGRVFVREREPELDQGATPTPDEQVGARNSAFRQIRRQGVRNGVRGLVVALVGLPVFLWHLGRARSNGYDQLPPGVPPWAAGPPPRPPVEERTSTPRRPRAPRQTRPPPEEQP